MKSQQKRKSLLFKYVDAQVNVASDDDVLRNKSLMKYAATKVYGQMACAVHALESAEMSVIWLKRLASHLDFTVEGKEKLSAADLRKDETNKMALEQITVNASKLIDQLRRLKMEKLDQAVEMEEAMSTKKQKLVTDKAAMQKATNEAAQKAKEAAEAAPPATADELLKLAIQDIATQETIKRIDREVEEKERKK